MSLDPLAQWAGPEGKSPFTLFAQWLMTKMRHRWQQFLRTWKTAGWGLLTDELRPLQYGYPQVLADCAEIDAKMMLKAISSYGHS